MTDNVTCVVVLFCFFTSVCQTRLLDQISLEKSKTNELINKK